MKAVSARDGGKKCVFLCVWLMEQIGEAASMSLDSFCISLKDFKFARAGA